jgi:hypothetical protein
MATRRIFGGFCINRFGIGPLHYISSRFDFGCEFAEIFVIEKRLPDSPSQEVDKNSYSPQAPSYGSTRIFYNGILEAFFFHTTSRIVFIFVLFCEALGEALNKAAAAAAVPGGPLLPLTRPGSCTQEGPGFLNLSNLIL